MICRIEKGGTPGKGKELEEGPRPGKNRKEGRKINKEDFFFKACVSFR